MLADKQRSLAPYQSKASGNTKGNVTSYAILFHQDNLGLQGKVFPRYSYEVNSASAGFAT